MPKSFKDIEQFTNAYIKQMDILFQVRMFAVSIVDKSGSVAGITIGIMNEKHTNFGVYTFEFDFSEATFRSLRELCDVQKQVIDAGLMKTENLLDVEKTEDILALLAIIEVQLLTYIPAGWKLYNYFAAQALKLEAWSTRNFHQSVKDKAAELLPILKAAS